MTVAEYFKGLSDQTRLRLINLLLQGELCGCDIQHVLGLSQSNVSRHLNYLRRVGLVADRREGYRVFYTLADPRDLDRKRLFEYLRLAFESDSVFLSDLKSLRRAIRHGACTLSEPPPARRPASAARGRARI